MPRACVAMAILTAVGATVHALRCFGHPPHALTALFAAGIVLHFVNRPRKIRPLIQTLVIQVVYLFYWYKLFGPLITTRRRATFDEVRTSLVPSHNRANAIKVLSQANVLRTYQPRARAEGLGFLPEPPTPAIATPPREEDGAGVGEADHDHDDPAQQQRLRGATK